MPAPPTSDTARDFLTVPELAQRLGVSRSHAYKLVEAGAIPSTVLGRTVRISRLAYERWLAEKAAAGEGTARR